MKIYRLCKEEEIKNILYSKSFENTGNYFYINNSVNNHKYKRNVKYLHFFSDINDVMFMSPEKGMYIYEINMDSSTLEKYFGYGYYSDLLLYSRYRYIKEYAIDKSILNINDLYAVYKVIREITKKDYIEKNISFCIENINYENKTYVKTKKYRK